MARPTVETDSNRTILEALIALKGKYEENTEIIDEILTKFNAQIIDLNVEDSDGTLKIITEQINGMVNEDRILHYGNGPDMFMRMGTQALDRQIFAWDEENQMIYSRDENITGENRGIFETLDLLNLTIPVPNKGDEAVVNEDPIEENNGWYLEENGAWKWLHSLDKDMTIYQLTENMSTNITGNASKYPNELAVTDFVEEYVTGVANTKQDKLTAGEGITIDENNVISSTGGAATKFFRHQITLDRCSFYVSNSNILNTVGKIDIINDSNIHITSIESLYNALKNIYCDINNPLPVYVENSTFTVGSSHVSGYIYIKSGHSFAARTCNVITHHHKE